MKRSPSPARFGTLFALLTSALIAMALLHGALAPSPSEAQAAASPTIALPEILAIELPASSMTSIAPTVSPLKELLGSASAPGLQVTHNVTAPVALGATQVTWTAWSGAPGSSQAVATRQAWVYVFPFGQTPAGVSGRYDATAGNHSAKVVRDPSGRVHVAWLDAARPGKGTTILYRSGVQDPGTGRFAWDTPVSRISEPGSAVGMVSMEASPNALHFAWATQSTTRYLRVLRVGDQWRPEPIRDTRAAGGAYDNGSDLAVRGDEEIHVLTYEGQYAVSTDGGSSWRAEQVPWPPGEKKNPALAVDALGNAHVVYTLKVRAPTERKGGQPNGSYWQLRYVRRQAQGGWVDAQDVLGAFPEWGDQGSNRDVLADWPDIAVDRQGNLHVGFHGTANSGRYGQDEAFYVRRPAAGQGAWGAWERPVPLHPVSRATRQSHSFAPSLALDTGSDTVLAVVFFDYQDQNREVFDSDALTLRGGRLVGAPIALSRNAKTALDVKRPEDALATWFASAAPRLYHQADGRVWLDVLYTAQTPERHGSPHYVIYQRREVTDVVADGPAPPPTLVQAPVEPPPPRPPAGVTPSSTATFASASVQKPPPPGTWAQITNSAIFPAMAPEATGCPSGKPNCGQAELWSPYAHYAYSGGDLATINGVIGLVTWGGGHADSPDNSLMFAPLDGSPPRRLSGPYLVRPGDSYYPTTPAGADDGLEAYRAPSRNQPGLTAGGAPKARHTYACVTTIQLNGKPHFFTVGGGMTSRAGFGTATTRLFDLTRTYAQAMARDDMGWVQKTDAPGGTLTCAVGWDNKTGLVIVRARGFFGAYNPATNTWAKWGSTAGGSDYEASSAVDVEGRKMYVLGTHVAEVIDLDAHTLTPLGVWDGATATGPAWVKPFLLTYILPGAYGAGPGLVWHPGRKRLLVYSQQYLSAVPPIDGTQPNIFQIDPVTGTVETLVMQGLPEMTRPGYHVFGRFRLIPGTDTVVLAGYVDRDLRIGQLPASGSAVPSGGTVTATPTLSSAVLAPTLASVPVAAPTPVPAPPPTPLPPTAIPGTFLGATGEDKVGPSTQAASNGTPDWHLQLTGVASDPVSVNVDSFKAGSLIGRWNIPVQPNTWIVSKSFAGGTLHLWIEPFLAPDSFTVTVVYADGTSAIAANILPPTPSPTPTPTPAPVAGGPTSPPTPVQRPVTPPAPRPAPAPQSLPKPPSPGTPSPGTVWVKPGDPIPPRQWVERLNGFGGMPGGQCNPSQVWIAESCGLAPGKHTRTFYHPGLKGLVIAGGDRAVGMPFPGPYDGTGSEILLYQPGIETWTTIRPFCVPGETQPGRPDNVIWALDAKRNRAIMAQGYYLFGQMGGNDKTKMPHGVSGCDAVENFGSYVFHFDTKKYTGPDDPNVVTIPPGNWGGDMNSTFGIIDPVNDELLVVRNGVGLQRMNLATKAWRMTPLVQTHAANSQTAIDVRGRALYYLSPMGLSVIDANGNIDQRPYLVKVLLDDPSGKQEFIVLPWPFQPFSGADAYLAFDTANRVIFVPNNLSMGGAPMVGLGIYHVDTGVWEWEDVPAAVRSSLFGFDENTGVLVGMSNRSVPYASYLYKYGGTIKALPVQPPLPPVQKTALLSESFNRADGPGLGPDQPWTLVESKMQTVANHAEFVPDPNATPILPPHVNQLIWASARVEKDLPSEDMEVWLSIPILEGGGGYLHEVTTCAAARFSATAATYYAVCVGIGEGQHLRIMKVVNGVGTSLTDVGIGDQVYRSDIRIRVTSSGAAVTLTAFYRGKILSTFVDSAPDRITQGRRAGVAGQGFVGRRAQMDDWRAGVSAVTP